MLHLDKNLGAREVDWKYPIQWIVEEEMVYFCKWMVVHIEATTVFGINGYI